MTRPARHLELVPNTPGARALDSFARSAKPAPVYHWPGHALIFAEALYSGAPRVVIVGDPDPGRLHNYLTEAVTPRTMYPDRFELQHYILHFGETAQYHVYVLEDATMPKLIRRINDNIASGYGTFR